MQHYDEQLRIKALFPWQHACLAVDGLGVWLGLGLGSGLGLGLACPNPNPNPNPNPSPNQVDGVLDGRNLVYSAP